MKRALPIPLVLLALVASGCPGDLKDPERFEELPICRTPIDVPALLVAKCGSSICHDGAANPPQANLDLTSPDFVSALIGAPADHCEGYLRIDPTDPDRSLLLAKLTDPPAGCGDRMPLVGTLTPNELACIRAYVHEVVRARAGTDGGP